MTPDIDYLALLPVLVVLGAAIISVLVEAFVPARVRYVTQVALFHGSLAAALAAVVILAGTHLVTAAGAVALDGPALFLQGTTVLVAFGSGVLICERARVGVAATSRTPVLAGFAPQAALAPGGDNERAAERAGVTQTEVFPLALFATGGLMLFPAANDLVTLFIALEVLSLPLYVLCGMARRRRLLSQEAALKYFLLGAFSSAIFAYGIAMMYGYAGTVDFAGIAEAARAGGAGGPGGAGVGGDDTLALIGVALVSVGLLFKVGAVPFHNWTPDVYQGAPTAITAFMAAAVKVAAFGAILRFFLVAVPGLESLWQPVLLAVAALTMVLGTVVGVTQNDVKRLLAYSSVAHAGFLLTGVIGGTGAAAIGAPGSGSGLAGSGVTATLFYLAAYAASTVGVFAVAGLVRDSEGAEITDLRSWTGLGRRQPVIAAAFAVLLLALAGIPLTSGFIAKFAVFSAAVDAGAVWLVVLGVLSSAVAASFYVRVIVVMFFRESPDNAGAVGGDVGAGSGAGAGTGTDGAGAGAGAGVVDSAPTVAFVQRPAALAVVGVTVAITLVLGILPQPLLDLTGAASTFAGGVLGG